MSVSELICEISSWVKIRLHTENQLPRLPRAALIVMISGVVWWWGFCGMVFLPNIRPPQQRLFSVVLGCWLGCGKYEANLINDLFMIHSIESYYISTLHRTKLQITIFEQRILMQCGWQGKLVNKSED